MSWFERHLNWTWVLAHVAAFALDSVVYVFIMLDDPYEAEVSTLVWKNYGLCFTYFFTVIPATFYVLGKKGQSLLWFFLSGITLAPLWLSNKNTQARPGTTGIPSAQYSATEANPVVVAGSDNGDMESNALPEIAALTERKGKSYFRQQPRRTLEGGAYAGVVIGASQDTHMAETILDRPHVLVDIDSPSTYCSACGEPMQLRMARYSGFDPETGVPKYRLVRSCPRATFYTLFGLVWQTDLKRHSVQGPTDTRLVLMSVFLALATLLIAIAVSNGSTSTSMMDLMRR